MTENLTMKGEKRKVFRFTMISLNHLKTYVKLKKVFQSDQKED